MNIIFEQLFRAWCPAYNPENFPSYLQNNPVMAYGQYAFEEGFKLALQLTVSCFEPEDLKRSQ